MMRQASQIAKASAAKQERPHVQGAFASKQAPQRSDTGSNTVKQCAEAREVNSELRACWGNPVCVCTWLNSAHQLIS